MRFHLQLALDYIHFIWFYLHFGVENMCGRHGVAAAASCITSEMNIFFLTSMTTTQQAPSHFRACSNHHHQPSLPSLIASRNKHRN
jgi:hypothetical protein